MQLSGLFLTLSLLIFACSNKDNAEDQDKVALKELETEITKLIEDKTCENSGQCMYIAFGSKPCGGPYKYLIFSAAKTDTSLLRKKVFAYNTLQESINLKYKLVSDCSIPAVPVVSCVQGECREAEN